ncbi:hypothetical protein EDD11_006659 [Mortierella claussenii]|nr:hypothetical protein EDD11_006659 [Mortierella claussenii]
MSYSLSTSLTYAPDVVDLEAMNITEMFPEASSYSFDMSGSYNNSYSDSISGIPLSQQALWDDGQLSMTQTANQSRVFHPSSPLSSLNNSANNSINHGHLSRHLLVPPPQHGGLHHHQHRLLSQHQGSPLRDQYAYDDQPSEEYEGSSLQNSWVDDTKDHNGIMLLNDKEHQDEQHLLFLQDIGAAGSVGRGDSISLFDKLADGGTGWVEDNDDADDGRDESYLEGSAQGNMPSFSHLQHQTHLSNHIVDGFSDALIQYHYEAQVAKFTSDNSTKSDLSCDLFKEELDAEETKDQSRLRFEHYSGSNSSDNGPSQSNGLGKPLGNEIFDQEFLSSLKAPLVQQPPPPLESATKRNFLEGLHTISAPTMSENDDPQRDAPENGGSSGRKEGHEAYQRAYKSFIDSLKVADPIKTPHRFAPQPLPILWNEPKIRSKNLPSFNLADYRDAAKATIATKPTRTLPTTTMATITNPTTAAMATRPITKRDSLTSSPINTHSIPNSTHSSPLSSIATSPPMDVKSRMILTPKTPTANSYLSSADHLDSETGAAERKQEGSSAANERIRRPSTIQNPHLAFDPTISPSERAAVESKSAKNTMERRSTLQQAKNNRSSTQVDEYAEDEDGTGTVRRLEHRESVTGSQPGVASSLRGPVARKRRPLHQDMFAQDQLENDESNDDAGQKQQQLLQVGGTESEPKPQSYASQLPHLDTSVARRGSRPLSANILPESLTSISNHAGYQETINQERARRLSEEEGGASGASKTPGTVSLGRAAGTRYGRSGSNASVGSSLSQWSPTTPTAANPYGTFTAGGGRTPRQLSGIAGSQRLSLTGLSSVYASSQEPDHDRRREGGDHALMDDHQADESQQQQMLEGAPVHALALLKLQSPTGTTVSRAATRSSPPSNAFQSVRRTGYGTQDQDLYKPAAIATVPSLPSPTDQQQYDDYYRAEREEQQTPRAPYLRQSGGAAMTDREVPEWQGMNEDADDVDGGHGEPGLQQHRYQTKNFRDRQQQQPSSDLRRSPSDLQKEQHNLQRLRVQQQAREDVYGRGYGNGYADDPEFLEVEYQSRLRAGGSGAGAGTGVRLSDTQQQQRYAPPSPSREYFSGTTKSSASGLRPSPLVPTSTMNNIAGGQSRYSEHYRRQSKDGHSLMPAPRISPPLSAMSTTIRNTYGGSSGVGGGGVSGSSIGVAPRRSLSNVAGTVIPTTVPSRRLSNAATVGGPSGYGSALPMMSSTTTSMLAYQSGNSVGGFGGGGNGGVSSLHGRSASTGAVLPRTTSLYVPSSAGVNALGGGGSGSRLSTLSDGHLPTVTPRRSLSTLTQPVKRASGMYGGAAPATGMSSSSTLLSTSSTGLRGSNLHRNNTVTGSGSASSSEYTRVFVPPRSNAGAGSGSYGNGVGHTRNSQLMNDDVVSGNGGYGYTRQNVPTRQSSLSGLHSRSSIATLRQNNGQTNSNSHLGGYGTLSSGSVMTSSMSSLPSSTSSSQLRRASSMHVGGGVGSGTGGLTGLGIRSSGSMTMGRQSGLMAHRQQQQQGQHYQGQYQYQPSSQHQSSYQTPSVYAYP